MSLLQTETLEEYSLPPHIPSGQSIALKQIPELQLVESILQETLQRGTGIIKEYCTGLLASGGKRLRPMLTLTVARCFGPINTATIDAAVAAELIHMASLVHDDVIDRSDLRRGIPTINALHGNLVAVLTGDYLFAEAFQVLSSHQLLNSMHYLVDAIQKMCAGEVCQAKERFNLCGSVEEYFFRISQKTGILLASCCKSGAANTGTTPANIQNLGEYGLHLGNTYQIIDDILDFTASSATTGKPVANDLSNGYITLPVLYLLQNPLYGAWAKDILEKGTLSNADILQIQQALVSSGSLDQAFNAASDSMHKALDALSSLPPSTAKEQLATIAYTVLHRKF